MPDFNTNGSVGGLLGNIMGLVRQQTLNQQHDEAFKTDQMLKNMNMSSQDIMNQMNLGQVAQPVQNGTVNEPTTSYSQASAIPGMPDIQTGVPGGPTAVAPDRQVVTYNSPSAGKQQYALNSPLRNSQLADAAADRARSTKGQDAVSEQNALETAREQVKERARQNQMTLEGGGTPAPATLSALGWKPGEPMTRSELAEANGQLAAQAKGSADATKATADARKTNAEAQGAEFDNQNRQKMLDALRTGKHPVDAIFPDGIDDTAKQGYKSLYDNAVASGSKTAPFEALAAAQGHLSAIQQQTNPVIQKAKLQQATAQGEAMSGIRQKAQDNEAAKGKYVSSAEEMNSAEAAAQDFMKVLDQADAGNTAAAAQIKAMLPELTNSVQGIKRMGAGQGNENIGSLGDRLLGLVGGITAGQPIDQKVRQQIRELVPVLATSAVTAHNLNVRTLNGTYGTQYPEAQFASSQSLPPGSTPKQNDVRTYQGAQYHFDGKQWVKQ